MRVISGKCRGTNLVCPDGLGTRPTTDRIKETLFNMIAFDLPECRFLDLFSGSGAIAIEALSRGASHAVLVDQDAKALKCINENLEKTRLKSLATVLNSDVHKALETLKYKKEQFDIIFMDPPYALGGFELLLQKIIENDLLTEEGYIILESGSNTIVNTPQNLVLWKEKKYKTTTMHFYKRG